MEPDIIEPAGGSKYFLIAKNGLKLIGNVIENSLD
jgi:hypothetical protein